MNLEKTSPDAPVREAGDETDIAILDEFVSQLEQAGLRDKAMHYRASGVLDANQAGSFRYSKRLDGTELCDETMATVGQRIIKTFGLEGFRIDPYLGWIVSFIEPGGFVHPHFDRQPLYMETDHQHFRCNVMVSNGGVPAGPIIDGTTYRVEERALWAFFASDAVHWTHPNAGTGPRIVYQFGFAVPGSYRLPNFTAKPVAE